MKFVKFILTITVIVTLIKIDFSVEASDYIIGEEDILQI